jgi:phosphoglycerate dehydrogenase-like enzyme
MLDAAPRLRVISNFGVGFNNVDLADCTRRGIAVCNTPGVLSGAVADLTMLFILAAARHFSANSHHARRGGWSRDEAGPELGFDLPGKTLGLVGYGRIGRETATRARAFGMRVVYYDALPQDDGGLASPLPLTELLGTADIVSLHVNLTPETLHLIGARELALMKPGAWLVNTSRGPVIDQTALAVAVRDGRIAGAALDVLEVEPPPEDEPLLTMPNVITMPHIGSATVETRAAMLDLSVSNLLAVLNGEVPPSCVNPEALARAFVRR